MADVDRAPSAPAGATPGGAEPPEEHAAGAWSTASLPEAPTEDRPEPSHAHEPYSENPATGRELAPGRVIAGRFRLDRRIGEGGMGSVWAATHIVTRKPVALKLLKADAARSGVRERLLREARAVCAVRHPNVVAVHDLLEDSAGPVLVMDLLLGETLAERLDRVGRLSLPEALDVLLPVASAVGAAHALGITHRDLKPANVFLAKAPDGSVSAKVVDFGIAKLAAPIGEESLSRVTDTGAVLGTPCYMAPEQAFGESDVDHRADLWALGIMLYQCLSGVLPTRAENVGQVFKLVVSARIAPIETLAPDLPVALTRLVGRMLDRDREARPADMNEVIGVLASCRESAAPPESVARAAPRAPLETAPAVFATPAGEPSSPRRARLFAWIGAGVLVAAAGGAAMWRGVAGVPWGPLPSDPGATAVTAGSNEMTAASGTAGPPQISATNEPADAPRATDAPRGAEPAPAIEAPPAIDPPRVAASATALASGRPRPAGSSAAGGPTATPSATSSSKNLGAAVVKTPPF